jgi:hypothetical protein
MLNPLIMVIRLAVTWDVSPLAEERILMMDWATTRARSDGALFPPPPCSRWGLAKATVGSATVPSHLPIASEVDRLYRQLMEIHASDAT